MSLPSVAPSMLKSPTHVCCPWKLDFYDQKKCYQAIFDHLYAVKCTECTVAWLGQIKYKRQITNLLQVFITVLADLICVRCIQKKIIGPGIFLATSSF